MCSPIALYSPLAQIIPPRYLASLQRYHQPLTDPSTTTAQPAGVYYYQEPLAAYRILATEPPEPTDSPEDSAVRSAVFSLSDDSLQKGVSVTPLLGIVYVSDPNLLQSALDDAILQGSGGVLLLEILRRDVKSKTDSGKNNSLIEQGDMFQIFLQWSKINSPCIDKVGSMRDSKF